MTVVGRPRAMIAAHGLRLTLPDRWEARLYRRVDADDQWADESVNPVLHVANFALPPKRGDFGTGAVEIMRAHHAFMSLVEYDPDEAGAALFAPRGVPRPELSDFAANALQRRLVGQLGCQRFFSERGRPFCLYVVLGSRRHAEPLLAEVHAVLDGLEVGLR